MDRSIRKSVNSNHFDSLFVDSQEGQQQKAIVVNEIFEGNIVFERPEIYLLKESIKTMVQLRELINGLKITNGLKKAIENLFYVDKDLNLRSDLRTVLLDNTNLAFFVGAGVSKLLNIPLWNEIADEAINYLRDNYHINHIEADKLKTDIVNPKQKLTIFHRLIKDNSELKGFYQKYLNGEQKFRHNPYELLWELERALSKPVLKISTNMDKKWIDLLRDKERKGQVEVDELGNPIEKKPYSEVKTSGFNKDEDLDTNCLYQIHGSIDDLFKAIITTADYVKAYRDDQGLKGFLEKVFREYIVLFIGSGMQEFEILEHCLKGSTNRHFLLIGSYIEEQALFRVKRKYFEELKIIAIPYYLDFQNYERLLFVLQTWIDEIESSRVLGYYEALRTIDEALAIDE
jgi:hypothetical protein